jgi:hypothetical protein
MQAIRIFSHSIRQITGNLGPALRISAGPMILQYAVIFGLGALAFPDKVTLQRDLAAGHAPFGLIAAMIMVTLFCGTWMAVAWHRFVLKAEMPAGPLPALHGERMVAYLGRSLLLGLALVAVEFAGVILLMLVSGMLGAIARSLAILVMIPGGVVLIGLLLTLFYRLSPMLPAAALGEDASLRMAWEATRGRDVTLFTLALIVLVTIVGLSLPQALFSLAGLTIFAFAWEVVASWAAALILLSVFTTVYGVCVQGRELV